MKRKSRRWNVDLLATLRTKIAPNKCRLRDLSPLGAGIHIDHDPPIDTGAEVMLEVEGLGSVVSEVRHSRPKRVGLRFTPDSPDEATIATWLQHRKPPRSDVRYPCRIAATIKSSDREFPCVIVDISRGGASVTGTDIHRLAVSSEVLLVFPGYGTIAAIVKYINGDKAGFMLIDGYDGKLPPE